MFCLLLLFDVFLLGVILYHIRLIPLLLLLLIQVLMLCYIVCFLSFHIFLIPMCIHILVRLLFLYCLALLLRILMGLFVHFSLDILCNYLVLFLVCCFHCFPMYMCLHFSLLPLSILFLLLVL